MRNSQQPPKYGAEGPPGGINAWAAERMQPKQMQGGVAGMGQALRGMVDSLRVKRGGQPPMPGGPPPGGPPGAPPASAPQQGAPQMQRPVQQTGMAGLGQAAGRMGAMMSQAAALRGKGQQ